MIGLYFFLFIVIGYFAYSEISSITFIKKKIPIAKSTLIKAKVAVLIPAYMDGSSIIKKINTAMDQEDSKDISKVIVVAESLSRDTKKKLKQENVKMIELELADSNKVKSIKAAINKLINTNYGKAIILNLHSS